MSQNKVLLQLCEGLEDPEMDEFCLLYLAEVDYETDVINCNGPWDGGLDMRNIDIDEIQFQYQITTRKLNFEKKLFEDLEKAQKNVKEYSLTKRVKYFYSYEIKPPKVLEYKKKAGNDYGIQLTLIEGSALAQTAASYPRLKEFLIEKNNLKKGLEQLQNDYFEKKEIKTFYEFMSLGNANDIKYQILQSFVINELFKSEKVSKTRLLEVVNQEFSADISEHYFENFLNKLQSSQKIISSEDECFELTDNEKERVSLLLETYGIEEVLFRMDLNEYLREVGLEDKTDEIIAKMVKLNESRFEYSFSEYKSNSNSSFKNTAEKFESYLTENLKKGEINPKDVLKKLGQIADKHEIVSRVASGKLYTSVQYPDRLQEYITQNINNRNVFLDTNIMIVMMCILYNPNVKFESSNYKIAHQLQIFGKENDLSFTTIQSYIYELSNLFKEALALVPFTKIPVFEKLGPSNNMIYKHFNYLKQNNFLNPGTNSFEDFLKEFRLNYTSNIREKDISNKITHWITELGISIDDHPHYSTEKAIELIEIDLRENSKTKSDSAIKNDAIMLERLGDDNTDINPMDPIFCTWDRSMIRVRKKYFDEYPTSSKWLVFTPSRLMDHFSMMNLKIGKGTLCNELVSLIDEDFDFKSQSKKLLDSLLIIINANNETGIQHLNKVAEIREKEVLQVNYVDERINDINENYPIDQVFDSILSEFLGDSDKLKKVQSLFSEEESFEKVSQLIENEAQFRLNNNSSSEDFMTKFHELLE